MRLILSSLVNRAPLRDAVIVALPGDVRISWQVQDTLDCFAVAYVSMESN